MEETESFFEIFYLILDIIKNYKALLGVRSSLPHLSWNLTTGVSIEASFISDDSYVKKSVLKFVNGSQWGKIWLRMSGFEDLFTE